MTSRGREVTNSITRRGETARPARDNLFWGGEDGSPSIAIGTRERKKVVTEKRERGGGGGREKKEKKWQNSGV